MALKSEWTPLVGSRSLIVPEWGRRRRLVSRGTWRESYLPFGLQLGLGCRSSVLTPCGRAELSPLFLYFSHSLLGIGSATLQLKESTQNNQETK